MSPQAMASSRRPWTCPCDTITPNSLRPPHKPAHSTVHKGTRVIPCWPRMPRHLGFPYNPVNPSIRFRVTRCMMHRNLPIPGTSLPRYPNPIPPHCFWLLILRRIHPLHHTTAMQAQLWSALHLPRCHTIVPQVEPGHIPAPPSHRLGQQALAIHRLPQTRTHPNQSQTVRRFHDRRFFPTPHRYRVLLRVHMRLVTDKHRLDWRTPPNTTKHLQVMCNMLNHHKSSQSSNHSTELMHRRHR